jgi:hypothetical protein
MFQAPDRHGLKWIPIDVAGTTKALGLAFQNTADAHMKTSSARSDDEASSTDEHLAGAAKTKSKKTLTFNELLEEVLAFLLAMSVRQQCTGGAKDKGSSLTNITNSRVKGSGPTTSEVSIPNPFPPPANGRSGGASGGEDSRYVDGGWFVDDEDYADAGRYSRSNTAEAKQQVSSKLPSFFEFRANFVKDSSEVPLMGVRKPAYFRYIDAGRNNLDGRTGKVYAVFSWHDEGTSNKQPAVVFAVTNCSDSMTLDPEPMVFPKGYLNSQCWSILNQDRGWTSTELKDFVTEVQKTGAIKLPINEASRKRLQQAEILGRIFSDGSPSPLVVWMLSTDGLAPIASFPEGCQHAGIAVEHALALSEGGIGEPRSFDDTKEVGRWEQLCLERTGRALCKNSTTVRNLKVLKLRPEESSVALFVDMWNIEPLKELMSGDNEMDACRCIVTAEIDFATRTFKVKIHTPSWLPSLRMDELSSFIVLLTCTKSSQKNFQILCLVPQVGSTDSGVSWRTVEKASTVIQGSMLKKHASLLWKAIVSTPSFEHIRFRPNERPSRWLSSVPGFADLLSFCVSFGFFVSEIPGDGNCWIWAPMVAAGVTPCPSFSKKGCWTEYQNLYGPVAHRGRQIVASVLLGLHRALVAKFGLSYDRQLLFPEKQLRDRWEAIVNNRVGVDPLVQGNYGSSIELAAFSFALDVNFMVLNKYKLQGAIGLKEANTVQVLRCDCSKQACVTITDSWSGDWDWWDKSKDFFGNWFRSGTLNEKLLEIEDFLEFNLQGDGPSCFFGLLGLEGREGVIPHETMQCALAKCLLDARLGVESSRPSILLMHSGIDREGHYEPWLFCNGNPMMRGRKATGLDCITERLLHYRKCSPVLLHLTAVTLRALHRCLQAKGLVSVHKCVDNDTAKTVARRFALYNADLTDNGVIQHNTHLFNTRLTRSTSRAEEPFPLKPSRASTCNFKLGQDTLVLVPLNSDTIFEKSAAATTSRTDDMAALVVCNSAITMFCHNARQILVKQLDREARNLVLGVLERLRPQVSTQSPISLIADSPTDMETDMTRLKSSSEGQPAERPMVLFELFLDVFVFFTRIEALADILCDSDEGTKWLEHAKMIFRLSSCCKNKKLKVPTHELWLAACAMLPMLPELDFSKLERLPVLFKNMAFKKGMLVQASEFETFGNSQDVGFCRRKRLFRAPRLIIFWTGDSGWGVFALETIEKFCICSEYAGRVCGRTEALALVKQGLQSHLRVLEKPHISLDGREHQAPFPNMPYYATNHMVSV